jgi:DNA-binding CsgD family transcriptional regulator
VTDPVSVIESAYAREEETERQWLARMASELRFNLTDASGPLLAWTYDVRPDGFIELGAIAEEPGGLAARAFPAEFSEDEQAAMSRFYRTAGLESASSMVRRTHSLSRYFEHMLFSQGFRDMLALNSIDAAGSGCVVGLPTKDVARVPPSTAAQWARISVHVGAGLRLHRKLRNAKMASGSTLSADAVLTPAGRVEHASARATSSVARESLKASVLAMERARGPLRRRDPLEAVEVWRGLVAGLWSLVDHFDTDGRRYLVAHRNDATAPDPRGLTERERQIAAYAELGQSNKLIAYQLGLSTSTVAVHLARARAKLQVLSGEEARRADKCGTIGGDPGRHSDGRSPPRG